MTPINHKLVGSDNNTINIAGTITAKKGSQYQNSRDRYSLLHSLHLLVNRGVPRVKLLFARFGCPQFGHDIIIHLTLIAGERGTSFTQPILVRAIYINYRQHSTLPNQDHPQLVNEEAA